MMSAVRPILTSIPSPELSTLSPEQYELVRRKVLALVNIDLAHYKSRQMQRRLNALLTRSGKASWEEYFLHLERNPEALRSFKAYLTINVSRFFRDRPKWDHLAGQVLPELLQERRRLRIWSAGCSNGAEAYTLAMILHDLGAIDTGHYILATDIDTDVLEKAKQGGPYTREDVQEVPTHHLATHFDVEDEFYRVRPDGFNPDRCVFEIMSTKTYPAGEKAPRATRQDITDLDDPEQVLLIPRQDLGNLLRVQKGLHSKGCPQVWLASYQEQLIMNMHKEVDRYLEVPV